MAIVFLIWRSKVLILKTFKAFLLKLKGDAKNIFLLYHHAMACQQEFKDPKLKILYINSWLLVTFEEIQFSKMVSPYCTLFLVST